MIPPSIIWMSHPEKVVVDYRMPEDEAFEKAKLVENQVDKNRFPCFGNPNHLPANRLKEAIVRPIVLNLAVIRFNQLVTPAQVFRTIRQFSISFPGGPRELLNFFLAEDGPMTNRPVIEVATCWKEGHETDFLCVQGHNGDRIARYERLVDGLFQSDPLFLVSV